MPTIRIDDEVYAWLQKMARPFEDTPNSVLRRIACLEEGRSMKGTKNKQTTSRKEVSSAKTPQHAFRKPIMTILKKWGGEGSRREVLKELERIMADQFTEFDKSDIKSGTIRWQKSAEWEVRVMREQQLLKPVSETPSGIWSLTDKGLKIANTN